MTADWETRCEWITDAGVNHRIEQRYDRSEKKFEARLVAEPRDNGFIKDRWYLEGGVEVME